MDVGFLRRLYRQRDRLVPPSEACEQLLFTSRSCVLCSLRCVLRGVPVHPPTPQLDQTARPVPTPRTHPRRGKAPLLTPPPRAKLRSRRREAARRRVVAPGSSSGARRPRSGARNAPLDRRQSAPRRLPFLLKACNLGTRTYRFSAQRRAERLLEVRAVHDHGSAPEPLLHHSGWHLVEYPTVRRAQLAFRVQGFSDRQHRLVQAKLS